MSETVESSSEPAGLPLGGIGTGCVEIDRQGVLKNATLQNNRRMETRIARLPGSFFGVRISSPKGNQAWLLRSEALPGQSLEEGSDLLWRDTEIAFQGRYPVATLQFRRPECPLSIDLVAFSPVIPHDYRASSLPIIIFAFTLKNIGADPVDASLLFSWENLNGSIGPNRSGGRKNIKRNAVPEEGVDGLLMFPEGGSSGDNFGQYAQLVKVPSGWNTSTRTWNLEAGLRDLWTDFRNTGHLGSWADNSGEDVGAVCAGGSLKPSEEVVIPFALAWHFPVFVMGREDLSNRYAGFFASAQEIGLAGLSRWSTYLRRIEEWWQSLFSSSLPEWLQFMLINSLYVLTTNSFWTKDGRFAMMETPWGPFMGSVGQRMYSSIATCLFFPDLEESEMRLISEAGADGRIQNELGNYAINSPRTSKTRSRWTDLNAKFILMEIRNVRWSGDEDIARETLDRLKKIVAFATSLDLDGDSLPDQAGRSTAFEDWAFYGTNPYASSLHLAALKAICQLARAVGEEDEAASYEDLLARGQKSFESQLWNDELGYYILYNDERNPRAQDHPVRSKACQTSQLSGQWQADFLGLGLLVPEGHIQSALIEIFATNGTPFGLANGRLPDGSVAENPDSEKWRSGAEFSRPGCVIADFIALAIAHDHVELGLQAAQGLYENVHQLSQLTWNQPLSWNLAQNAPCGWGRDRYINSSSAWHVLFAMTGFSIDLLTKTLWLRPAVPTETGEWVGPVYFPGGQGTLGIRRDETTLDMTLHLDPGLAFRRLVLKPPSRWKEARIEITGARSFDPHSCPVLEGLCETELEEDLLIDDVGCSLVLRKLR